MLVLNTTSPCASPAAPAAIPRYQVPSSSANTAFIDSPVFLVGRAFTARRRPRKGAPYVNEQSPAKRPPARGLRHRRSPTSTTDGNPASRAAPCATQAEAREAAAALYRPARCPGRPVRLSAANQRSTRLACPKLR